MEQQQADDYHMRLPLPVTSSAITNSATSAADSHTILHLPSHQQHHQHQHQHMQPADQAHHSFLATPAVSPPFGTSSSSSLSPRLPGSAPAFSPPTYAFSQQNHDSASLDFPDPPSTELAPLQLNAHVDHSNHNNTLPSLASLTGASAPSARRFAPTTSIHDTNTNTPYSPPPPPPNNRLRSWPSGNPYSAYYAAGHGRAESPLRMDLDATSNGSTRAPLSPDNNVTVRASSVSLDDPDVRMAAEALGHLRADFVSSPQTGPSEEPLLSLVVASGSLLAKPIEGTVSAYTTTKNFSPGFIKTPVEYVEGVVGSGLYHSGIEGGVRWLFRSKGRHQSSGDLEAGENSNKRRRVDSRGMSAPLSRRDVAPFTSANGSEIIPTPFDPYGFTEKDRRLSMSTVDTLPAYDDARSPAYSEDAIAATNEKMALSRSDPSPSRRSPSSSSAWQSRLIRSTSGLSIAMSEESLRSLKYCLHWLRKANEHIGNVIKTLKDELERYEATATSAEQDRVMNDIGMTPTENSDQARLERGARIDALKNDVLKTLRAVIETVSKYTGGALPDNARALVRRHLTSLPQRFRLATQESGSSSPGPSSSSTEEGKEKEVREGAQRVLVLAKEGLDMMAQVSNVLDGTIISAEEWCTRLGKKTAEQRQQAQAQQQEPSVVVQTVPLAAVDVDMDVKMREEAD